MSGTKHDAGKAPLSLIPHESLTGTAEVLAFGAKKYAAHNWRGGFHWSRLTDAALRHITAFNSGEDTDPESGLSHIDHAACCIAFLQAHIKSKLGKDDRYKAVPDPVQLPLALPPRKLTAYRDDKPAKTRKTPGVFNKGDKVRGKANCLLSAVDSCFDLHPLRVYTVTSAQGDSVYIEESKYGYSSWRLEHAE